MTYCKVLKFCEKKCDCEKNSLAAAIAQPHTEQAALVREVPQLRDDCLCHSYQNHSIENHQDKKITDCCCDDDPDIEQIVNHILNHG